MQAELVKSTQTIYFGHLNVEIIAVSDLFAGPELEAWAAARRFLLVTKDSNELINHPDIDAIFICSSTDTHVPLIQQAARRVNIFSAKNQSVWISRKRKQRLMRLNKAGVKLQIGFNRRFDHNFKRVQEVVQGGALAILILLKSLPAIRIRHILIISRFRAASSWI